MDHPTLTIVVPAYNEAENIPEFIRRLHAALRPLDLSYELLVIDDGSTDRSLEILREIHEHDARIGVVSFTRNFGHQAAIVAGLDHARGAAVICMDADLQHQPELIPEMVHAWREGSMVVHMVKEENGGVGWWRRGTYAIAYAMLRWLSGGIIVPHASDFYLLDHRVVGALRSLSERARFIRGLIHWFGFPARTIPFSADSRYRGVSQYSFRKLFTLLFDGLTAFSRIPLRIASVAGVVVSFVGFAYAAAIIVLRFTRDVPVAGWTTVVVLILVLGGLQLFALGVIGEYLGRTYEETKGRPMYIVRDAFGATSTVDCSLQ